MDVSSWSVPDIAGKLSADGIQVCINLNGYTKGARWVLKFHSALKKSPAVLSICGGMRIVLRPQL